MKSEPFCAIVGTPIGNLDDISKRAFDTISKADVIFAEDTPKALGLLSHMGLKKRIVSCHKDNEKSALPKILKELEDGKRCVIISEAGMPCVSDPGTVAVRELIKNQIPFEIVSGPTALIHGIIASGFCGGPFYFNGFPPHKISEKKKLFENLQHIMSPIIFYESPHRVKETVKLLLQYFPTPVAICRELTKMFEETLFVNCEDDLVKIMEKGEFVLVVNNFKEKNEENEQNSVDFTKFIDGLRKEGFSSQDIVKILKNLGVKRNEAYRMANSKE